MARKLLCFGMVSVVACQIFCQSLTGITTTGPAHDKIVNCYVLNYFRIVGGYREVEISDLVSLSCTRMVTPFVKFSKNSNTLYHEPSQIKLYKKLQKLKSDYPGLKTFFSVYGKSELRNVTKNYESRSEALQQIVSTLRNYNFDGLELSWYDPQEISSEEESNFIKFVKMLKNSFESKGYTLTVEMDTYHIGRKQYDLFKIIPLADFVVANFYHYRSVVNVIDAKAPLRGLDDQDERSVDYIINFLLKRGVSKDKILLGIPQAGYNYEARNLGVDGIMFADTVGRTISRIGPLSVNGSFHMRYWEVCLMKSNKSSNWVDLWHDKTTTPYLLDKAKVVVYENTRSAVAKVKMGIDYGLRGFSFWNMGMDDFDGTCDPENDTYVDFVERLNKMNIDSVLVNKTLRKLDLPDIQDIDSSFVGYYVDNNRIGLQLPVIKQDRYPLFRAVNTAILLASQEKRIADEMKKNLIEAEAK